VPVLKLHYCPDPESSAGITEVYLTDVEAYYYAWMECCLACGSTGDPSKMIFCMDCGEAFHPFCIGGLSVIGMDDYARCSWRCVNCKLCELCGGESDDVDLIQCELCDKGYHLSCLSPPLTQVGAIKRGESRLYDHNDVDRMCCIPSFHQVPKETWFCGSCVDCQICSNSVPANSWSCHEYVCYRCGGRDHRAAEEKIW